MKKREREIRVFMMTHFDKRLDDVSDELYSAEIAAQAIACGAWFLTVLNMLDDAQRFFVVCLAEDYASKSPALGKELIEWFKRGPT